MSVARQAIIVQSEDSPELRPAIRVLREPPVAPSRLILEDGVTIPLPAAVTEALQYLVAYLLDDGSAAIGPAEREYSVDEAADFLGVTSPFVDGLVQDGTLSVRQVDGTWRIALADLLAYDSELRVLRAAGVRLIQQRSEEAGVYGE